MNYSNANITVSMVCNRMQTLFSNKLSTFCEQSYRQSRYKVNHLNQVGRQTVSDGVKKGKKFTKIQMLSNSTNFCWEMMDDGYWYASIKQVRLHVNHQTITNYHFMASLTTYWDQLFTPVTSNLQRKAKEKKTFRLDRWTDIWILIFTSFDKDYKFKLLHLEILTFRI